MISGSKLKRVFAGMAISLSLLSACASGRQLTKPEMETAGRGRVERIETLDPIKSMMHRNFYVR